MRDLTLKLFYIILLLPVVLLLSAAGSPEAGFLYPIIENGYWGFINGSGDVVTEPQFDYAYAFTNGAARVRRGPADGGKFGYVDGAGTVIVSPKFSEAYDFCGDFGRVRLGDKYGFVNLSGTFLVSPQFQEAGDFYDDRAKVLQDGWYGFINTEGVITVEPQYVWAEDFNEGFALVKLGVPEVTALYEDILYEDFVYNTNYFFIPITNFDLVDASETRRVYVTNETYESDLQPIIRKVTNRLFTTNENPSYRIFTNRVVELATNEFRAYITNYETYTYRGEPFIITTNETYQTVTEPMFVKLTNLFITDITNYSYRYETNNVYEVITNRFRTVITNYETYTRVSNISLVSRTNYSFSIQTNAIINVVTNRTFAYENRDFTKIITNFTVTNLTNIMAELITNSVISNEITGYDTNRNVTNARCGYITISGRYLVTPAYKDGRSFSEGMAAVLSSDSQNAGEWGFINENGDVAIEPQFDDARDFHEGYAAVKVGNKWTYVDMQGNLLMPPSYAYACDFSEGFARVNSGGRERDGGVDGGKWGIVDTDGNEIIDTELTWVDDYSGGMTRVQSGSDWGLANSEGSYAVNSLIEYLYPIYDERARVMVLGKYGYFSDEGKVAIAPVFIAAADFYGGLAMVSQQLTNKYVFGYINTSGQYVWASTNLKPTSVFTADETVNVLGPNLTIYKTDTIYNDSPTSITTIPIGEAIIVSKKPTSTKILEAHGLLGTWVAVEYFNLDGATFSGYLSRYAYPETNGSLIDYFRDKVGIICASEPARIHESSADVWELYRYGISMEQTTTANKTTVVYDIPHMSIQEAFALAKICLGYPELPLEDNLSEDFTDSEDEDLTVSIQVDRDSNDWPEEIVMKLWYSRSKYKKVTIEQDGTDLTIDYEEKGF